MARANVPWTLADVTDMGETLHPRNKFGYRVQMHRRRGPLTTICVYARKKDGFIFRSPFQTFSFTFLERSSPHFTRLKLRRMLPSCLRLTPFSSMSVWLCSRSRIALSTRVERLPDGHGPAKSSADHGSSSVALWIDSLWRCKRDTCTWNK